MLTEDQTGYFARNGFVRVEGAVAHPVCDELIRLTQTRFPAGWDTGSRATWHGQVTDSCHTGELRWFKGLLKFQDQLVLEHPTISHNLGTGSPAWLGARQLIGADLAPLRVRGLYPLLSTTDSDIAKPFKPHIESHPVEIVAFSYLADVEEEGGGLLVWPGSHRDIYPAMLSKIECVQSDAYREQYDKWTALQPIALTGRKGDVFLIHHRLLHAPNINKRDEIRYAVLADYKRANYSQLCRQVPRGIWDDWPAIASLPAELRDGDTDFASIPVATTPRRRATDSFNVGEQGEASIRKRDGSMLQSLRKQGDLWIHVSDGSQMCGGTKAVPRGSNLNAAGVGFEVNGTAVDSPYEFDLFCQLPADTAELEIRLSGLPHVCWAKVIRLEFPFEESKILCFWEVQSEPGDQMLKLDLSRQADLLPVMLDLRQLLRAVPGTSQQVAALAA